MTNAMKARRAIRTAPGEQAQRTALRIKQVKADRRRIAAAEADARQERQRAYDRPEGKPIDPPTPKPLPAVVSRLTMQTVPLDRFADAGTLAYCRYRSAKDGDDYWRLCRIKSCAGITGTVQFFDTGLIERRVPVASMVRVICQ